MRVVGGDFSVIQEENSLCQSIDYEAALSVQKKDEYKNSAAKINEQLQAIPEEEKVEATVQDVAPIRQTEQIDYLLSQVERFAKLGESSCNSASKDLEELFDSPEPLRRPKT